MGGECPMQIGSYTTSGQELRLSSSTPTSSPMEVTAQGHLFLTMNDTRTMKDTLEEDIFLKQNKNHLELDLQRQALAIPHMEETSEDWIHYLLNKANLQMENDQ